MKTFKILQIIALTIGVLYFLYIVSKSFFNKCKIGFQKWYLSWFIKEANYRFKNKPDTLNLAKRYHRYKMYVLNK